MQKWIWNSGLWNRQGAMHTAFSLSRNRETMTWHGQGILNILFFMNFTKAIIITKYCLVRDTWIMHHNLTWWNARGRIALESRKGFPCNFVFYSFPNCTQLPKVFLTVRRNNNVTAPIRIICPVPRLHYSGSVNHSRVTWSILDMWLKWIGCEGLGESHTGTRQVYHDSKFFIFNNLLSCDNIHAHLYEVVFDLPQLAHLGLLQHQVNTVHRPHSAPRMPHADLSCNVLCLSGSQMHHILTEAWLHH